VLRAVEAGSLDLGFVALENAIEGTVNATLDTLAFDVDLLIQREVVMPVQMNLLGLPGTDLAGVRQVLSFPHASAQCRDWLNAHLPQATVIASNSTADAARIVSEGGDPSVVAIANALSAKLYSLDALVEDIEDHPGNATRFVVVSRQQIPPPSGHDKTMVVVYQRADVPGSLLAILQEFAARAINLTKLESRPTKLALGDYCFIVDLEGHVTDEVVGDCLRDLKSKQADVKFLGSYPAAGEEGPAARRDADTAWREADAWLSQVRSQVRHEL
jgi:prephenate dehydratase